MEQRGGKTQGRKSHGGLVAAVAVILAAALLLVFVMGILKPTAVSLTKKALENVSRISSAKVGMLIDLDGTVRYEPLDVNLDLGMDFDIDMDAVRSPLMMKGSADVLIDALGKEQKVNTDFYFDGSGDDAAVTYLKVADSIWTNIAAAKQEKKDAETSVNPMTVGIGIVKAVSEKKLTANLEKDTVLVRDKEAWKIFCRADGTFLKQMIDANVVSADSLPFKYEDVEWEKVQLPAEIFIYKQSKLPARIILDCGTLGAEVLSGILQDVLAKAPVDGISFDITGCTIDMTFDNYDEVSKITIPEEVKKAPDAGDFLSLILSVTGIIP